ncbi:SusD/RagB family nutrient-binding outer membrane lipoprotein [Hwangdonia lutea]|uniref:SusD/RagB family nutrient-binding outer membrane lipoprotein n=1 Tax=Hwangdonia lutea TaxID=3075823 RepID=A0AA97ELH1_9FLAO|nr:SusD/RagB family nutrient-binding outer membrane lipoprotein [Hwangdonia sp. SCSIO 19198]WOD43161.1 SusD/RagB family nutrient-binding outer membrane lipoprotein [Hwangdonia sp. SCSIO 19198]
MKKIILLLGLIFTFNACDDGFEELNVNPTKPVQLAPSTKLTAAQLYTAGTSYVATLFYNVGTVMQLVQQINATSYSWEYTESQSHQFFNEQYPSAVKAIVDLVDGLEKSEDPNAAVDLAIANVWKVLVFSRLTDSYGDIPYFEAGKGFIDGIRFPKYDAQSEIYTDMLALLESASNTLSTGGSNSYGSGDIVFGGDTQKWHKFANSLMLRLALRLVKVDPSGAEAWATKAINGGVMTSNADIAYINYQSEAGYGGVFGPTINPIARTFSSRFGNQIKMSETFVEFMKDRNDPRVSVLCSTVDGETDFDLQFGQPNIDRTRGAANSKPNMNIFGGLVGWSPYAANPTSYDAPFFFQTYAEVEFMLAEAAHRWGLAGGNTEDHYNAGVTAAMDYLSLYGNGVGIDATQISDYLTANPFDDSIALQMINEQYWVATFPNGIETWANWKRSGYPSLTPVPHIFSQTDGTIPRRFIYPATERANNPDNLQEAIDRQGDILTSRMWWDAN